MPGYLILAGTTKAATTALFAHLARHPEVSPARIKEPRFFLDPDYPLETAFPFARGLAAYESLFPPRPEPALRLEATPDYLHSPGSARRIRATLADARVLVSLRDPVARLASWYRFARGSARLPRGTTLAEYVRRQLEEPPGEQPFRALAQGDYEPDVRRFLDELGRERVHVIFYEELLASPATVLRGIAAFAGLSPGPLEARGFEVRNRTRAVHSPRAHRAYVRLGFHLRNWAAGHPRAFAALRRAHGLVRPLYWGLNGALDERVELDAPLEARLVEHYAPGVARLAALLGRDPPWPRFAPVARLEMHAR